MKNIHANISQGTIEAKNEYRSRIDLVRSRVNLLAGKDKLLMTMYLENGNSFSQMARLAGVNEACIARRIRKIIQRLTEGEYIVCQRYSDKFTRKEMAIAKDYFLRGASIKKISGKRRYSYYSVHMTIRKIKDLVETLSNKSGADLLSRNKTA